jgi:hypothetical protein
VQLSNRMAMFRVVMPRTYRDINRVVGAPGRVGCFEFVRAICVNAQTGSTQTSFLPLLVRQCVSVVGRVLSYVMLKAVVVCPALA